MPEVSPKIHEKGTVERLVCSGEHASMEVLETIGALAIERDWESLWSIADMMGREVSVLFDSKMRVWVDVGTAGQVELAPPLGSTIPFRLWIHTHPRNAYWSSTDLMTIASHSLILERALVLGFDHMKATERSGSPPPRSLGDGALMMWTEEPVVRYEEVANRDV
jgi:hypothetical protein